MIGREFGASLVCVTLGAQGSLAWCNGREIRTPAFPVDCVDSTGAGDCFRGAFAAACLAMPHGDIEDVLSYANAVAALNCRALGSRGGAADGRGSRAADARRPGECNFRTGRRSNPFVVSSDGIIADVDVSAGAWPPAAEAETTPMAGR